MARKVLTAMVAGVSGQLALHFCSTHLRGTHDTKEGIVGREVWFPLPTNGYDLFDEIERILIINKVAHNVVSLERTQVYPACTDYKVTYNEPY